MSTQPDFLLPRFVPHPWLRTGHLQTIVGSYWPMARTVYQARQHVISLVDGDRLVVHDDVPAGWTSGGWIALLVHGLGGSHLSSYVVRAATKLNAIGIRTFRMDLRGCGTGYNLARRSVHAGRSDDIAAVLACLRKLCPGSQIVLVGYSMAGNMAIKLAGEMGDNPPAMLDSVVTIAPPIDLQACSQALSVGMGKLYDRYYLKRCLAAVATRRKLVPESYLRDFPRRPRSLREFDDGFTAPLADYSGVEEYYDRASAMHVVERIVLPTLVVSSIDDPIVPIASLERLSSNEQIHLHRAAGGGHLGFIATNKTTDPDRHWIDWRIVDWAKARMSIAAQNPMSK